MGDDLVKVFVRIGFGPADQDSNRPDLLPQPVPVDRSTSVEEGRNRSDVERGRESSKNHGPLNTAWKQAIASFAAADGSSSRGMIAN